VQPSMTISPGDRMLVTGASGFIGSAVTRALLARDAKVVALLQPGVSTALRSSMSWRTCGTLPRLSPLPAGAA
jgi:dihydroflavonol-4-reductase